MKRREFFVDTSGFGPTMVACEYHQTRSFKGVHVREVLEGQIEMTPDEFHTKWFAATKKWTEEPGYSFQDFVRDEFFGTTSPTGQTRGDGK